MLKNSVYVLPNGEETLEDLHWLRREILDEGGEATVSMAEFVEGQSDVDLVDRFRRASEEEYTAFVEAVGRVGSPVDHRDARRLRAQLRDVAGRDFFNVAGGGEAERALAGLMAEGVEDSARLIAPAEHKPVAATWVTRRGVHIDRMASAWLIRRFIDPAASFKFVDPHGYAHESGQLRFDMFEGEFTHEQDRCTFETLLRRFALTGGPLEAIGDIVHDIDCKVEPARREETEGVRVLVRGICLARESDSERLEAAYAVFDGLYAHFAES